MSSEGPLSRQGGSRVFPIATPADEDASRHIFPSLSRVNTMTLNTDDTLLTPDNHAVMLIDHQYLQLLTVRSHSVETIVNNATFLAEGARIFNVPTLFTTAFAERQAMFAELQAVHPEQQPIDRFGLNAWDDERVREWVKNTGKKKLVMAGLWTEVCLTMPVLSALPAGFEAYIVTDASGASSVEAHERAVQRMVPVHRQLCQRSATRLEPGGHGRAGGEAVRTTRWVRARLEVGMATPRPAGRHALIWPQIVPSTMFSCREQQARCA